MEPDEKTIDAMLKDFIKVLKQDENNNPYNRKNYDGKKDAVPIISKNIVTNSELIRLIFNQSFDFREFQNIHLYHKNGFFENMGPYEEKMVLLPQILAPGFGMFMGESTFQKYLNRTQGQLVKPTVLSLAAGQGFLDHDLIKHVTSKTFMHGAQMYSTLSQFFGQNAEFIISDIGNNALKSLPIELKEITKRPDLENRVHIIKIDAMDFNFSGRDLGLIYTNELVDNLPTEPIALHEGNLYCIKIIAYNLCGIGEQFGDALKIEKGVPSVKGVISKDQIKARIEAGDTDSIGFATLFIPVEYDPFIKAQVESISSISNISNSDFGGIYPLHIGLDPVLKSIKNSFRRGNFTLMDYTSSANGAQNYSVSISQFQDLRFGKSDIDFKIDSAQVIERALKQGFFNPEKENLSHYAEIMMQLTMISGKEGIQRQQKVMGREYQFGQEKPVIMAMSMGLSLTNMFDYISLDF